MEQSPLPSQQKAVYDFIKRYHTEQEIAPSIRDIANSLQVSVTTARIYVGILKNKGYVTNTPGIRRSLRITKTEEQNKVIQEAE
jgi:SOS-response transcriptional repressor LexA